MKLNVTLEDVLDLGEEIRKHVIAHATPEERLHGLELEERLRGLEPEELQALIKQLETYLGDLSTKGTTLGDPHLAEQRNALSHVLQRKFGALPAQIVKQIAATNDSAKLDEWLDQAIQMNTLTALTFD